MSDDEWTIQKIADQQAMHRTDVPVQQNVNHVQPKQTMHALSVRIQARYERYNRTLADKYTSKRMLWKIARAVEERRIEEERIEAIWPRLETVKNRGAYFATVCKGAFKAVGLSWLEEEWQGA